MCVTCPVHVLTLNGSCYSVLGLHPVYAALTDITWTPAKPWHVNESFHAPAGCLLSLCRTPLHRLFSHSSIPKVKKKKSCHAQISQLQRHGLLMTRAAAESESVPVIAQEFTKLFTVVALKDTTDLTDLTKCSTRRPATEKRWRMSPSVSSSAIPIISCATWYGWCR